MSFDQRYERWSYLHAAVAVLGVAVFEIAVVQAVAGAFMAVWTTAALTALYVTARHRHPEGTGVAIANLLTSVRVGAAVSLFLLVSASALVPAVGAFLRSSGGWLLVGALLLVEVTDFLDGRLARKHQSGSFGSTWDMESDAIYALALSLAVRHLFAADFFVLFIGLMRYLYVLLWRSQGVRGFVPRAHELYAKTTTAVLVTTLIVVMAPPVQTNLRTVSLVIVLLLQLVSFGWDIALQVRPLARESKKV
jgi:phosphatidylglycerophosphate synthase